MTAHKIVLRKANPEYWEGLYFARYLNFAAEGFFQFMLGKHYEDIIARAYQLPQHDLSFENATFAELDGEIVGMFSGFTAQQHQQSPRDILLKTASAWNLRARIVKLCFEPMMNILDTIGDSDFYLQAIAVDGNRRGRGIGTILLGEVEERAREAGADRLALDVAAKNTAARHLYERLGFSVISSWPRTIPLSFLKLHRMVKPLD